MTPPSVEGRKISGHKGVVFGEAFIAANAVVGVDLDTDLAGQLVLMDNAPGTAVVPG